MLHSLKAGLCLLLLPYLAPAAAQPAATGGNNAYKIRHLGVEDGLSQGSVSKILRDSRGYQWMATRDGVNRFDGVEFRIYGNDPSDHTSLEGSTVTGLVEDPHGIVWAGTERCLNAYIRRRDEFEPLYSLNDVGEEVISSHYPFGANDSLLFYMNSHEGILTHDLRTGERELITATFKYQPSSYLVNAAFLTPTGHIWLRNPVGLASVDPATGQERRYFSSHADNVIGPPLRSLSFHLTHNGIIWFGSDRGLVRFDPQVPDFDLRTITVNGTVPSVIAISAGPDQLLYLGTEEHGGFMYNPTETTVRDIPPGGTQALPLSGKLVPTIYSDPTGLTWVNVEPFGVDLLLPNFKPFKRQPYGARCFLEGEGGRLWVGTLGAGLASFDPRTGNLTTTTELTGLQATALARDSLGTLWVGTYSGLYRLPRGGDLEPVDALGGGTVTHLLRSAEKGVLVSTEVGVFAGDTVLKGLAGFATGALHEDRWGRLLVARKPAGFLVTNAGYDEPRLFLPKYHVKSFYADARPGVTWLATTTGLVRVDHEVDWSAINSTQQYTIADGLPSNYVYGILPDERGQLWMSTNRGLARFDPASETFTRYGLADGLQGLEFNTNAFLRAASGEVYFGGTTGFNYFSPREIGHDTLPAPAPRLTGLSVNGQPRGDYLEDVEQVELAAGETTFRVHFASLDYRSGPAATYRVRLREFERGWTDLGTRRSVRYTNIPPGRYVFEVQAMSADGVRGDAITALPIRIAAAWYLQNWFRGLCLFLLAVAIYLTHRYLVARRLADVERAELASRLAGVERQRKHLLASSKLGADAGAELRTEEQAFLTRIEDIVRSHLSDGDFSVQHLARALGLSRSQVHRKIKAATGLSTTGYLRAIRLRYATNLLASEDLTIAEVAYQTGFSSPAYFSRVYKETFGSSPGAAKEEMQRTVP